MKLKKYISVYKFIIKMAYLFAKICVILLISSLAAAQISAPDNSWSNYQVKSCCPTGYTEFGNYCVKCASTLFFDAITGKCASCPEGHSYNSQTNRCQCSVVCKAPRAINSTTNQCQCPVDDKNKTRVYNSTDNTCNCPADLPLWNGKYCVACPNNSTYDPAEHQCYHCPEGFVRDGSTHTCVPSLDENSSDTPAHHQDDQTTDNLSIDQNQVTCPPETLYDALSGQCFYCPDGFSIDEETLSCIPNI